MATHRRFKNPTRSMSPVNGTRIQAPPKAFEALEQDIFRIQTYIDSFKENAMQNTNVMQGKLNSRRQLPPTVRTSTPLDSARHRNMALTDSLKTLSAAAVGENYALLPQEHCMRLMTLKISLQDGILKKIIELCNLHRVARGEKVQAMEGIDAIVAELGINPAQQTPDSDTLNRYKELVQKYSAQEKEFKQKIQVLETKITQLSTNNTAKEEAKAEFQAAKTQLVAQVQKAEDKASKAEAQIREAEAKVQKAEAQLKQNIDELHSHNSSANTEKENNEKLISQIEQQKTEMQTFQDKIQSLEELVQWHEKSTKEAELFNKTAVDDEMEELKAKYDEQIKYLQGEMQSKDEEIGKVNKEKLEIQFKHDDMCGQLKLVKTQLEKKDSDMSTMQNKHSLETQTLASKIKTLENNDEAQKYENLIESYKETEKILQEKIAEQEIRMDAHIKSMEGYRADTFNLKDDIQWKDEQIKTLQERIEELNKTLAIGFSATGEDTFEEVMRQEMVMMRNAYEKKLADLRQEKDQQRRESFQKVKAAQEEQKRAESVRDVATRRLNVLLNKDSTV